MRESAVMLQGHVRKLLITRGQLKTWAHQAAQPSQPKLSAGAYVVQEIKASATSLLASACTPITRHTAQHTNTKSQKQNNNNKKDQKEVNY